MIKPIKLALLTAIMASGSAFASTLDPTLEAQEQEAIQNVREKFNDKAKLKSVNAGIKLKQKNEMKIFKAHQKREKLEAQLKALGQ